LLLVGFSKGMLGHIEGWARPGSVVVVEEPDVFRKKQADQLWRKYSCIDEVVLAPYNQSRAFVEPILAQHARSAFTCVVPGVEYAVSAAAEAAEVLDLPGATPDAACTLRDKIRLRETTTRAGLAAPEWREVTTPDQVRAFVRGGPTVLKPANRQASLGVRFLDRAEEVDAAWQSLVTVDEPRQLPDRALAWRYMVERRMFGQEFSVEALVRAGEVVFENITRKSVVAGDSPVEVGHLLPAPVGARLAQSFCTAMRALTHAIGFHTGILHAEWIAGRDGVKLVECAGRIPGDNIIELIDLAYEMRLCRTLVGLMDGQRVELPSTAARAAAIRFLSCPPGLVTAIHGVEDAAQTPGVIEVKVAVGPGDRVRPWRSSWDRVGHVMVSADAPERADALACALAAAIRIDTR
jgi:biotin carboxylase